MKRILALDGGGLRGVIPASFLAEVERRIGAPAGQYFDLIAGTSTGGLIALGLGLGYSAQEILRLYKQWGPVVFPQRRGPRLLPPGMAAPMYDLDKLARVLREAWGDRRLGESRSRLVITAYDLKAGTTHVWRTAHVPAAEHHAETPVLDVALSTSAAPVYFDPYRTGTGLAMVDGGVWASCPVMVAVAEAIWELGWDANEIFVLSLGCSHAPVAETGGRQLGGGLLQWAPHLVQLFLKAQEDSALAMARRVLGPNRVVRIDPPDPTGNSRVDDPADMDRLSDLGRRTAVATYARVQPLFFAAPAEPFAPVA